MVPLAEGDEARSITVGVVQVYPCTLHIVVAHVCVRRQIETGCGLRVVERKGSVPIVLVESVQPECYGGSLTQCSSGQRVGEFHVAGVLGCTKIGMYPLTAARAVGLQRWQAVAALFLKGGRLGGVQLIGNG